MSLLKHSRRKRQKARVKNMTLNEEDYEDGLPHLFFLKGRDFIEESY